MNHLTIRLTKGSILFQPHIDPSIGLTGSNLNLISSIALSKRPKMESIELTLRFKTIGQKVIRIERRKASGLVIFEELFWNIYEVDYA